MQLGQNPETSAAGTVLLSSAWVSVRLPHLRDAEPKRGAKWHSR